ncbi:MAG: MFS transporter [Planctomycetes bacterium]|nr:MFS transporter [Planctomycetota bacterium]
MSAPQSWQLRWRLSVLWALEWGITGALLTYLPLYFTDNGLSVEQLGQLMAVSAVGLWVAPFVVGQVCDRWMATQKYLAVAHFLGGVTLLVIPFATEIYQQTQTPEQFRSLLILVGIFAVAYFPTIPLASSLSFRHLAHPESQFGKVRIWGTVGWVLSGLLLSVWLGRTAAFQWLVTTFPEWKPTLEQLSISFSWLPTPTSSDCFRIAAVLSFALSGFCVFLPDTPPERTSRGKVAPIETLSMFKDRNFSLLIAISFLLAIVVPFYSFAVPKLLESLQYGKDWVPAVMTVGQISEFPALLLLPWCLKRFGLKMTFGLGMAAWVIRYFLFALHTSDKLILTGIALNGICHVFLIIVIQLFIDAKSRSDLKASAQNLFAFLTMGIAMPIGFLLAGTLGKFCEIDHPGSENYRLFFAVPAVAVLLLLGVYWKWVPLESEADSNRQTVGDGSKSLADPVPKDA